jgi:hypothetical protein
MIKLIAISEIGNVPSEIEKSFQTYMGIGNICLQNNVVGRIGYEVAILNDYLIIVTV